MFEWRRALVALLAGVAVAAVSWWMLTSSASLRQIVTALDEGADDAIPVAASVESVQPIGGLPMMTVTYSLSEGGRTHRIRLPSAGDQPGDVVELSVLPASFATEGGVAQPVRLVRGLPTGTRDAIRSRADGLWLGGLGGLFVAFCLAVVGLHHLVPSRPSGV